MIPTGVLCDLPDAFDKRLGSSSVKRERLNIQGVRGRRTLDLGAFGGNAECVGADSKIRGGLGKI